MEPLRLEKPDPERMRCHAMVTRWHLRFKWTSAFRCHSFLREEFRAALWTQWNLQLALDDFALVRSTEPASATPRPLHSLASCSRRDANYFRCSDRPATCRGRSRTSIDPSPPLRGRTRAMHIRRSHAHRDELLDDALLRLVSTPHSRDRDTLSDQVGRGRVERTGWSASR